jgi:hypothetical protein
VQRHKKFISLALAEDEKFKNFLTVQEIKRQEPRIGKFNETTG